MREVELSQGHDVIGPLVQFPSNFYLVDSIMIVTDRFFGAPVKKEQKATD